MSFDASTSNLRHKRRFKKGISVINDEKLNTSPECNLQSMGFPQYMDYHGVLSQ